MTPRLKIKTIAVVVLIAAGAFLLIEYQTQLKLRVENQSLRQQVERLAQLTTENDRLSNLVAQAKAAQASANQRQNELLKLRGEVALLHKQTNELAGLRSGAKAAPSPQAAG